MENKVKYARLSMLIICIIYFCLGILAVISEFSVNTNDSSVGQFSFGALVKVAWWPFLMVLLMVVSFVLYNKKAKLGAIVEVVIGIILLVNTIRNIISYGTTVLALILSLLLPIIFILQGGNILINKKKLTTDEKLEKLKKEDELKVKQRKSSRKDRR